MRPVFKKASAKVQTQTPWSFLRRGYFLEALALVRFGLIKQFQRIPIGSRLVNEVLGVSDALLLLLNHSFQLERIKPRYNL